MSTQSLAASVWNGLNDEKKREINLTVYKERVAEISELIAVNNDEIIFYVLSSKFDFDKHMLRRLWEEVEKRRLRYVHEAEIISEVEKNSIDGEYLKRYIGVDVAKWRELKSNWKPENDECWMEEEAED